MSGELLAIAGLDVPPPSCAGRFDPWEHVAAAGIAVTVTDKMPAGMWGATDGHAIWIDAGLTQFEARSTLAHELVHHTVGHGSHQSERVERRVDETAAVWLLPDVEEVLEAARWARSWQEWAEECRVDVYLMRARMRAMSAPERKAARAAARVGFSA